MAELRVLVRHWRLRGTTMLTARHPSRLRAIASTSRHGTLAAVTCLTGLLLPLVVAAATAGAGWDYTVDPTAAARVLVPLLLGQIAVAGGLYLSMRALSPRVHDIVSGLWLLPLAVTALMAGGAGRAFSDTILFVWGCTGLAITLWVIGLFETGAVARFLCYSGPLLLLALWSAAGPFPEATVTAGVTVTVFAAAGLVVVPGFLVIRGVSDLPRVHRWAASAQRWLGGGTRLFWVVGAKVALLVGYLLYAEWRFPDLVFIPRTAQQWGAALLCAVLALLPMRVARRRTLDETRIERIGQVLGFTIGSAVGLAVCLALGSVVVGPDGVVGGVTLLALLAAAAVLARTTTFSPRRQTAAVLLTPLAVVAGFVAPLRGPGPTGADEISMTWLVAVLLAGAGVAVATAGWLAWRHGEFWWGIRALLFIGLWIGLVEILRATGIGLAGVDLVLTMLLVGAALWIHRRPRSRIAVVEVVALCAVPVVVIYLPDLLAGLASALRPWFVATALVAPGLAALWHHIGLAADKMTLHHSAGLAGVGALYGMVGACVLVVGTGNTETISAVAQAVLAYVGIPLTILFIALLEGRASGRRAARGVASLSP